MKYQHTTLMCWLYENERICVLPNTESVVRNLCTTVYGKQLLLRTHHISVGPGYAEIDSAVMSMRSKPRYCSPYAEGVVEEIDLFADSSIPPLEQTRTAWDGVTVVENADKFLPESGPALMLPLTLADLNSSKRDDPGFRIEILN